jgi:hypothetical protein
LACCGAIVPERAQEASRLAELQEVLAIDILLRDVVATCPQRVLDKRYSNVGQVRRVVRHLRGRELNDEFNGGSDAGRDVEF